MSKIPKIGSCWYFCNILRKKYINEVYFWHADKHEWSTHSSSVWLGIMWQKSSHFESEWKCWFVRENLIKELIVLEKFLWIRKGNSCMHVISTKMFHICKDFLFPIRNSQVSASCFIRGLTLMSALFPWFKLATFLKLLNLIGSKLHHT